PDPRAVRPGAFTRERGRARVPPLPAEQPLGLDGDHGARRDGRRPGGLRLLPLPVPGSAPAVLRGDGAQHVPGGRVPHAALHHDAVAGPGEHACLADPDLPHLRAAAVDLAAEGVLRQHPRPARAGGPHRRRLALQGVPAGGHATLRAGDHRDGDLRLHHGLERVRLRAHLPQRQDPPHPPRPPPPPLHSIPQQLAATDGGLVHHEHPGVRALPRAPEVGRQGADRGRSQVVSRDPARRHGPTMAEVTLKDVVKTYGRYPAVDRLSLTIPDGEFVALVGPSGCGKTTTLNLVAGLLELSAGEIRIGERLVNDLDPKDRDVAMVFQNYALYPNKTVYKNLAFPLRMRKTPKGDIDRRVREAAKVLDIGHLLERRPRELSGGQQQRVALGRALVRDPKVFLMDEPLSNLDAKLRVQMRAELKRFHQDLRATVIYVTHDQLEAVTMADRMAVMDGGVLQQYDRPERVFDDPVNLFVA